MIGRKLWLLTGLIMAVATIFVACIFIAKTPHGMTARADMRSLDVACKAHLYDGSLVLFPKGFVKTQEYFLGSGTHWNLDRTQFESVDRVVIDSVAFLEYYYHSLEAGPIVAGLLGPAVFLTAVSSNKDIKKAIFGSCPTIYTHGSRGWICEAECFSYSIAPWYERSDLDRLDYGRVEDGIYPVKLRNEALETHYVNSLSLLAVDHPQGYEAFPDPDKNVILFGQSVPLLSATDQSGRDVLEEISARDERWWESDTSLIRRLEKGMTRDWIDVRVDVPSGARTMAVALRLRNTLMNTVYFYDVALRSEGVHVLEWMDWGVPDLIRAWPLKDRYSELFGLKIERWDGHVYKPELNLCDAGPICWRLTAAELEVSEPGFTTLRFSSLPGNWAIDWIGVSFDTHGADAVTDCKAVRVQGSVSTNEDSLAALLSVSDSRYLVTYPRDAYQIDFRPPPLKEGMARSYFISSSGFYVEWIRHEWFGGENISGFAVRDEDIERSAGLWLEKKEQFEAQFFGSRLAEAGRTAP